MPDLPDTLDDRLTLLGKVLHEQDDEQMARIKALEAENTTMKGLVFTLQCAVAQLQSTLPQSVTPLPLPEVGAPSDAIDVTEAKLKYLGEHLFSADAIHRQVERGEGGNSYTAPREERQRE